MESEAKKVVLEFLTAIQEGDNAKLGAILHPKIIWNQPGDNLVSGIKRSNMEVFEMVAKMFEIVANSLRLSEVKSVAVNGNQVSCLLQWEAEKATGERLDTDNIDVYTVEGGQITKADIFLSDIAEENRFWN